MHIQDDLSNEKSSVLIENADYCVKPLTYDIISQDTIFQMELNKWLVAWNFQSFNRTILELNNSINNCQTATALYSFHENNSKMDLVGLIILQHFTISSDILTDRLIFSWIINPAIFRNDYRKIALWGKSNSFWELIQLYCQENNLNLAHISFIFSELPESVETEQFSKYLGISAQTMKRVSKADGHWVYYLSLCDERFFSNTIPIEYQNNYQFLYYNPIFDQEYIHPDLIKRMHSALNLYDSYSNGINPPNIIEELVPLFKKVIKKQELYIQYKSKIQESLEKFKKLRKEIWNRIQSSKREEYCKNFIDGMSEIILRMKEFGLRHTSFSRGSSAYLKFLSQKQIEILLCLIESIPTEGSMFKYLIDADANVNPNIKDIKYLRDILGDYMAFIEFEIEPNQWILAGYTPVFYRKSVQTYSKQLVCGLVFSEAFRSYGLGELSAYLGLLLCENMDLWDIAIEDATIHNFSTHRLVERIGFHQYGLIQNQEYDLTGLFGNNSFLVGCFRTFRLSSRVLYYLIQKTQDQKQKSMYLLEYQINQGLLNNLRAFIKSKNISEITL